MNEPSPRTRHIASIVPAVILCALSVVWACQQHERLEALVAENHNLTLRQAEIATSFFGEALPRSPRRPNYLAATLRRLDTIKTSNATRGRSPSHAKASDMYAELSEAIDVLRPEVNAQFTSIDLDPRLKITSKSSVSLEVAAVEDTQAVLDSLNERCQLLQPTNTTSRSLRDGSYELRIEFRFKPELLSNQVTRRMKRTH